MVVLAAGIVSSKATLFSRQFVDMPRMRVEGLFNSFPKLVDKTTQHTFVDTESVRYLYQPKGALEAAKAGDCSGIAEKRHVELAALELVDLASLQEQRNEGADLKVAQGAMALTLTS